MSTAKERATGMNRVALRQSIMRLPMVIGGMSEPNPPEEREFDGQTVYLGNYYDYGFDPKDLILEGAALLGRMNDENLMHGMPPVGGVVEYIFVPSTTHYLLFAALKLDEMMIGESYPAEAPVAWIERSSLEESDEKETEDDENWNYHSQSIALLITHLKNLFSYHESSEAIHQEFEGNLIEAAISAIKQDIDRRNSLS